MAPTVHQSSMTCKKNLQAFGNMQVTIAGALWVFWTWCWVSQMRNSAVELQEVHCYESSLVHGNEGQWVAPGRQLISSRLNYSLMHDGVQLVPDLLMECEGDLLWCKWWMVCHPCLPLGGSSWVGWSWASHPPWRIACPGTQEEITPLQQIRKWCQGKAVCCTS